MPGGDVERHRRLNDLTSRIGPYEPPHNIHLGDDVWTITDGQLVENSKLRRVVQLAADTAAPASLDQLRVIDLACEGGVYGIELARRGAAVLGVEGRAVHVERARFAAQELGLDNYEVEQADVRAVRLENHGQFDVVLCLGILYHLDCPDLFEFVHELGRICRGFMILDTQVSLTPRERREHGGNEYHGSMYPEHSPGASEAERIGKLRASLDNSGSFWLTHSSLYNLLADAGFTSVLETRFPRPAERHADRVTLVAHKGEHQAVPSGKRTEDRRMRWPEKEPLSRDLAQTARGRIKSRIGRLRRG